MQRVLDVLTSADDRFAIGLAGTIKSVLASLSPSSKLNLWVLDGGISSENRDDLIHHWNDPRLSVNWLPVDRALLAEFKVAPHMSDAAYYRLLAPNLLPSSVKKLLYIDADLLVQRDLTDLWDESFDGHSCIAVHDIGAPFLDSNQILLEKPDALSRIVCRNPIPMFEELGLAPETRYFNSGVFMIDLETWRSEQLSVQMFDVLCTHRERQIYHDQFALNIVLANRWKAVDYRWNQLAYIHELKVPQHTFLEPQVFQQYKHSPWVVHFTYRKPWQPECQHPLRVRFFDYLAGSKWMQAMPEWHPTQQPVVAPPAPPVARQRQGLLGRMRRSIRKRIDSLGAVTSQVFRRAA